MCPVQSVSYLSSITTRSNAASIAGVIHEAMDREKRVSEIEKWQSWRDARILQAK
jgi:hypothetical protein